MEEWGFKEFEREIKKAEERCEKLSLQEDDNLTRKARLMEAKNYYETATLNEQHDRIFKFRKYPLVKERFTCFWETKSPFSQWYRCALKANYVNVLKPRIKTDNEEHLFSSAEQYMMYCKAMLFLDREIAAKILSVKDVRQIKFLGRKIKNFEEVVWDFNKIQIVYEGNKAKFTQNKELKQALFATKGTTLVEAAPNDAIWGIGLSKEDPRAKKREAWLGKNLLGEILTQLRVDLMGEY